MNQIDRRIALKEISPCPLALIGLARDQQDAQPVAHAVDGEERAIIVERQLAGAGADLEFDHVGAGVADRDRQLDRFTDRYVDASHDFAADRQGHRRGAARRILDPELGRHLAADHAEPRRLLDDDQAVTLVLLAGDQAVQRRAAQFRRQARGHVVYLAVGQQHDAGKTLRRHFDKGGAHRFDQARAARPLAAELDLGGGQNDLADLQAFLLAELALQRLAHRLDLLAAFADGHRVAVVDYDQRDVGDRFALLLDQGGIGQRRQDDGDRAQAPDRAAGAGAQAEQDQHEADGTQHRQHRPRQQRIEGDGDGRRRVHRLSLCMMSGR